jgi:hypothetical protein
MRLNDGNHLSTNLRSDIKADNKVLGEFREIAVTLPDMNIGTDVDEGFRWVADSLPKLFEFKDALVKIVAVVHRDVLVGRLGTPNLGWDIDNKRAGGREGGRGQSRHGSVIQSRQRHTRKRDAR